MNKKYGRTNDERYNIMTRKSSFLHEIMLPCHSLSNISLISPNNLNLLTLENNNNNMNKSTNLTKSNQNCYNNFNQYISDNNESYKQKDFNLEMQCNYSWKIEFFIEEVFRLFSLHVIENNKINNREDIFRIISFDGTEIFIFRIFIDQDDRSEKFEKKSFIEPSNITPKNIKNFSSFRKSNLTSFLVLDESKTINSMTHSKSSFINIEFYGLQKPSSKLVNTFGDILTEKKLLVKLNYFNKILKNFEKNKILSKIGIEYSTILDTNLLKNSKKINENTNDLFKKAKISWIKLFSNKCNKNVTNIPEDEDFDKNINNSNTPTKTEYNLENFDSVDLKLIYEFSDRVNLETIFPAFSKINNISKNFSDDMIEYFKILKNNNLIVFESEDKIKYILIPELSNFQYCFYIKVIFNLFAILTKLLNPLDY